MDTQKLGDDSRDEEENAPSVVRVPIEPKYEIDAEGTIYNRASGNAIPKDEPVILFRAQDANVPYMLCRYLMLCQDAQHRRAVALRLAQVCEWQAANPERVKQPDTVVTAEWPVLVDLGPAAIHDDDLSVF